MTDTLVDRVRDALRVVIDPELGHNIVDLGFVYDISVADGAAIRFIKEGVEPAAARVPGIGSVDIVMTFDPPWAPARIAPSVRASLGFAAVN